MFLQSCNQKTFVRTLKHWAVQYRPKNSSGLHRQLQLLSIPVASVKLLRSLGKHKDLSLLVHMTMVMNIHILCYCASHCVTVNF